MNTISAVSLHKCSGFRLAILLLLCCLSCTRVLKADLETIAGQWNTHMDARDYESALDVYASAALRYPDDRELQEQYIRSADVLKDLGDKEYGKGEFGQAERIYRALLDAYRGLERLAVKPSFTRADLQERLTLARIRSAEVAAKEYFSRGDYRKGLDIYKNAYRKFGKTPHFLKTYAVVVEEAKQSADQALAQEDFVRSGRICRALLSNFSSFAPFVKTLSFTRQSLMTHISRCSSSLTGKGLELYRQGRISEAIAVWESILVFDDNPDIRRTIGTASEQLKKLQR